MEHIPEFHINQEKCQMGSHISLSNRVKPYYAKDNIQFWWDCPEYTGRDDESSRPARPDCKLMFEMGGKCKIYLIEMTVPWISNRKEKLIYKQGKYQRIQENLKFEHRNFEVDQITLVMDVFGGYGIDLETNIGKVIKEKETIVSIIKNMQKSVISSAANLSRAFKIRTITPV